MRDIDFIFVYGTLKVGGFYARHFDDFRLDNVEGYINGDLYNLRHFPALILGGKNKVYGEIHKYNNFNSVIKLMDQIEGYRENDIPDSLYVRKITKAMSRGRKILSKTVNVIVYEAGEIIKKELKNHKSELKVQSGIWEI